MKTPPTSLTQAAGEAAPTREEAYSRPLVSDCPAFKYTAGQGEARLLYRISCLHGWCDVVGDPDNGEYEWILRDEAGAILKHSDCGYGMVSSAMRDGLTADDAPSESRNNHAALVEALKTADNDIAFARGLIAEGQPADADQALNDAVNRLRAALATAKS